MLRVLFLSFCSWLAVQAAEIQGRVLDPSGRAAAGARVTAAHRAAGWERVSASDAQGEFRFADLPPGDYVVTASAQGLQSLSAEIVQLASPSASARRDLLLRLAAVSASVTVTGTGAGELPGEGGKVLEAVALQDWQRRGEISVVEALRVLPGVRVQQLGGPGAFSRVQIRGLRSMDTGVLIDGFRFRDAASTQAEAGAFWSDFQLLDMSRIEVLKGSGASLYGSHSAGGVVNLISDPGGGPTHGEVQGEGGGLGLTRGAAKIAGGLLQDRLRYSLGAGHLNVLRGNDGNDRHRNSALQTRMSYDLAGGWTISGRVYAADVFTQTNETPFAAPASQLPPSGVIRAIPLAPDQVRRLERGQPYQLGDATFIPSLDDPDSSRASRHEASAVTVEHRSHPRWGWRVGYQNVITRRDHRNGPAGVRFQPRFNTSDIFRGRIDTLQARVDAQPWRNHLILAGYEWEREGYRSRSTNEAPPELRLFSSVAIQQASHAFFVQDVARWFADRLEVAVAGRTQAFQLNRPDFAGGVPAYQRVMPPNPPRAWTGDAAVSWFFRATGTKLRSHLGNGYRAPSPYERFGAGFFFGGFTPYGDPRLAPERLVSWDGGLDQYFGSRLRLRATGFYTRLQQVIAFDFSGAIAPSTDPYGRNGGYRNTGGGLARGVELAVEANPRRGTLVRSGYTYTKAIERRSALIGGDLRTLRISPHMVTIVASQQVTRRLDVAFDLFAASSYVYQFNSRPFEFAGPVKADCTLNYALPAGERQLKLYLRLENFLNRLYYEDGFRTPGIWGVAGLRWLW